MEVNGATELLCFPYYSEYFLCVQQNKDIHTGLELLEGEFLGWTIPLRLIHCTNPTSNVTYKTFQDPANVNAVYSVGENKDWPMPTDPNRGNTLIRQNSVIVSVAVCLHLSV